MIPFAVVLFGSAITCLQSPRQDNALDKRIERAHYITEPYYRLLRRPLRFGVLLKSEIAELKSVGHDLLPLLSEPNCPLPAYIFSANVQLILANTDKKSCIARYQRARRYYKLGYNRYQDQSCYNSIRIIDKDIAYFKAAGYPK